MKNKFIILTIFLLGIFISILVPKSIYADCTDPEELLNYNGWGNCSCKTSTQTCRPKQGCFIPGEGPEECMIVPVPETRSCTPDPDECSGSGDPSTPTVTIDPSRSTITVRAKTIATGTCANEGAQFQILINNQSVFQATTSTNEAIGIYAHRHTTTVTADQVKIKYINDCYDPNTDSDRSLFVDSITIDTTTYQSESPSTYSEGSWSQNNQCGGGYKQQETLNCNNGFFQYSTSTAPPPTVTPTNTPTPTPTPIPPTPRCVSQIRGDANCDSVITTEDYDIWKCQYLSSTSCNLQATDDADFDRDSKYTVNDYEIWRRNYNFADPVPPTNTPTPTGQSPTNTPTPTTVPPTNTPTPVPPTPTPTNSLRVFVTSEKYSGNLGGISGANNKCQARAQAAANINTLTLRSGYIFKAWLSDNSTNAKDNIHSTLDLPYRLLDGTLIANNMADLTDGTIYTTDLIRSKINLTELKSTIGDDYVWTKTLVNGTKVTAWDRDCLNWTTSASSSTDSTGDTGKTDYVMRYWTYSQVSILCSNQARLYCFEVKQ